MTFYQISTPAVLMLVLAKGIYSWSVAYRFDLCWVVDSEQFPVGILFECVVSFSKRKTSTYVLSGGRRLLERRKKPD